MDTKNNYGLRLMNKGGVLIYIIVFMTFAVITMSSFSNWAYLNIKSAQSVYQRELAFHIAEAGIEYYRWHLAHDEDDFQDGAVGPGPYVHPYYDKNNNRIGEFILEITPPVVGSTVATVRSTGKLDSNPVIERIIEVKVAKPSWAKFSAVTNATAIRFGAGTEVFGAIHSNGGIRFDGLAHNLVTSALNQYDDPDHSGAEEWAVHTHTTSIDSLPPTPWANRTDIFMAGRQVGVPEIDFTGLTADLNTIRTQAITGGAYFAESGALGYHIILKDVYFELWRVNSLMPLPRSSCTDYSSSQPGWGTWSIATQTKINDYNFPGNGLIFAEDHLWVSGRIQNARLTIASARFPENPLTNTSISITDNVLYSYYDGRDVLALISQNNVNIGMMSSSTLRIDAALIAKNGRVGRYYYRPPSDGYLRCSPYHIRSEITSYGMIATNQRYGFAYTDGTGYQDRILIYDANMLYAPPPSFPLTTDDYEVISWKKIK